MTDECQKFSGMTVNERLFSEGILDLFYEAVEKKDVDRVEAMLRRVCVDEPSIQLSLSRLK